MKRYFLTIGLLSACFLNSPGQQTEARRTDSLKIDSMRGTLPFLKDSARVDCLNSLSEKCIFFKNSYSSEDAKRGGDSMYKYALMANQEATRIGYKYGLASSLLNLASSFEVRGPQDSANAKAKMDSTLFKYKRRALQLAKEIQDDALLGRAYYSMWDQENAIEQYKQSIYHYHKSANRKMELEVTTYLLFDLLAKGDYENAIEYADNCIQLTEKFNPVTSWEHELVQLSYKNMADIFKAAGDYKTALDYEYQSNLYAKLHGGPSWPIGLCELYYLMEKYDSAFHYWHLWKKNYESYYFGHKAFGNTLLGKIYIKMGEYDKAIELFNQSLNAFKIGGKYDTVMAWGLIRPSLFMGKAYAEKKDYRTALVYATQGLFFAKLKNDKPGLVEGYEIISNIYRELGYNDSAYSALHKYIHLKDSIQNRQFFWRLNNYKKAVEDATKEARLGFLNKDNQIKQQQLKQQATFRNFLIATFLAILFAGLYFFRNIKMESKNERLNQQQKEHEWILKHLESEKKQAELQKQAAELEMQALRAQMNPHFIFNCLSSINRFILKNESKIASNYLTRFSRLMRMVLNNSQKPLISLDDEVEMLELYLEMERLRFKNSFDYGITFLNTVDSDNIFIPPLLLQPFCENAIWHGLMHLPAVRRGKKEQGRLDIQLTMQDNILNCVITDNGVGREKAEEMNTKTAEKEKSLGLRITTERLALFNREQTLQTNYQIEDLKDEQGSATGTKVTLKFYFKKSLEELV